MIGTMQTTSSDAPAPLTREPRSPTAAPAVRRAEERFTELLLALNRTAPSRWRELGMTPQQVRLMLELSADGIARPMQLAQRMEIHVSTLSGITDRLVERGLVSRSPARDDRRCSDLALTEDGHRLLRDLFAGGCGALRVALSGLGRRRVEQLEGLLLAVTAALEAGATSRGAREREG